MNSIPNPPPPSPPGMDRARPTYPPDVRSTTSKRGAPVWAVLVITVEAGVLVCMVAVVGILALFGDQLAQKLGGAAATVGAGAAPLASSSVFYSMLDSHYYDFAYDTLGSDLALDYTPDRLREEWEALEESEGRTLPLPTNVQLKGNRATVSVLLSAARTNRTFNVELTLEQGPDETWYIVGADPSLIPEP